MVKGVNKRVIVVRSPDRQLFEQAIFILREEAQEVTADQVLQEAQRVAKNCRQGGGRLSKWCRLLPAPAWAAAGALAATAVWSLALAL